MFREFYIGDVLIKHPTVLAPMAGITNQPFREQIAQFSEVGLLCTEMISDKGIIYQNQKTLDMLSFPKLNSPISVQLFGSEIDTMVEATKYICEHSNADIIDINMGCPVAKVVKKNGGASLLNHPDKVKEIVENVVKASSIPVTVKIRLGWNNDSINYVEIAKIAEAAGASAITLHARTARQMYTGHANWEHIKLLKQEINIPLIGNGDITTPELALQMFEETKCDAVMIGRGSFSNPYIYREINDFLVTNNYINHNTWEYKKIYILDLAEKFIADRNENVAIREMRKFASWVVAGLHSSREYKAKFSQMNTLEDLKNIIDQIDQLHIQIQNEEITWKEVNKN